MYKTALLSLSLGIALVSFSNAPVSLIQSAQAASPLMYTPKVDGAPTRRVGGGTRGGLQMFTPKVDGAPSRRVGGGTRGLSDSANIPTLAVIAPEHTGLTISDQPTLYWYVSSDVDVPFRFTLTYDESEIETGKVSLEDSIDPVLETNIADPASGIQGIDLAKHDVSLKPDIVYRWAISMVAEGMRSNDVVTEGTIKLVNKPDNLDTELSKVDEKRSAYVYAQEGIWYDAIESLSDLISKYPNDKQFATDRETLLKQVGLDFSSEG
ncbi:DUF928 domain-containing protein [Candidatus Albibeggiatoa sp. nov. NOAA]|uniref:DUF928 domain-containing protein n=1 Tax=Candidatus Albibeggiatoa sp. nov. NOAA TaxID=3162724 RepID=UPI0032F21012|nr:DUF928 domain-containing protein [Thiotrichaceae bacterium]